MKRSEPSIMGGEGNIPFYARSRDERLALTEAAMRGKSTLIARWVALDNAESSHWNARAALAAGLLEDQPSVADFGCGTMTLAAYLRPNQRYIPIDVIARDDRTILCDLNRQMLPETEATAAAFLGVLEYLYDPQAVLRNAGHQYGTMVVSYCITDAPDPLENRREHAWVNDFCEAEVIALFHSAGWLPDEGRMVDGLQKIWRLQNPLVQSEL
ncbi:hypothetical protein ACELLULO517_15935 [Acidisoma cellulosilytica]|uniref:Uncharacterized protein n=1 Tax=Acidisoma cellulosilyticum TaxID=2802395 RepID=A0A963Z3C9_9PROT|nr:RRP8 family class I SAM-dependent methyltransferase [Acidisoma cellulosilyticum]MCB8881739.1 hypothetical protein [Acidisoma cellulosilyticum]